MPSQPKIDDEDWASSSEGSVDSYEGSSELVPRRQINWILLSSRLAINIFIPFVNGLMLGFGEIFAHELGFALGWRSARVHDPLEHAAQGRVRRKWLWIL